MPYGPEEDPYHAAARLALEGDYQAAFEAVKEEWIESLISDFEPVVDADEDGPYGDPEGDLRKAAERSLDGGLDQTIADAAYEVAQADSDEDTAMRRAEAVTDGIKTEFQKYVDTVASEAWDRWSDGQSHARDPYAHYGVNRKDFM
jgi:hypothetical protein